MQHHLAVADVLLGEWVGSVVGAINEDLREKRDREIFISSIGSRAQLEANKFSDVRVASAHTRDIATEVLLVEYTAAPDRRD